MQTVAASHLLLQHCARRSLGKSDVSEHGQQGLLRQEAFNAVPANG